MDNDNSQPFAKKVPHFFYLYKKIYDFKHVFFPLFTYY